jgi:hypothetical protein
MKTANFDRATIHGSYGGIPFDIGPDDWLISIHDPATYRAHPHKSFGLVDYYEFTDYDYDDAPGAFPDSEAERMANLIKSARVQNKNVYVHCQMGICRSGGVLRILLELGWDINEYSGRPFTQPNLLVYDKLRKHFPELGQSWDAE